MKTNLFYLFIFISTILFLSGCADNINNPPGKTSIEITKPLSGDTINIRSNTIYYDVIISKNIKFIELYVNGKFVKNYPPNPDGTKPTITINLDSTYLNKTISYQLKYYDENGFAETPVINNIKVAEEKIAPFTPYNIIVRKLSANSFNIQWQDSTYKPITHEIWRRANNEGEFSPYLTVPPGVSNINDDNVFENVVYFYMIRGYNEYGFSNFSTVSNTLGSGGSATIIAPELKSINVISAKTLKLTWYDNSNNENYFGIERKSSYGDFISIGIAGRNYTSFKDSGQVSAGAEYIYRIKAYSGNDSSWSNELSIIVPYYVLSAPSLILVSNPATNKVVFKWKDNDSHYANWLIERKTEPSGDYYEIAEVEGYLTTYEDLTVEVNKTYTYRIRCYDQSGFSGYSNEMGITSVQIPLIVPGGLTLKYISYYAVELKWNLNDLNASKVLIERRLNTEPVSAYKLVAEVPANQKNYYDTGTTCQRTYVYRLRSTDGVYFSNYSPEYIITNTDQCK